MVVIFKRSSVYDKRDDFGFPIVNFPWLSGDVPRLPSYGIYISQLVRFARCCTSVFDFHSKNLQIASKLFTHGYRYQKVRKTFRKFFRSYSELLSKFGAISFQDYVSQGITHPDLVYKLRRVKGEANFISLGSKIVKRLRRRQYDPAIIERTIGLVLGPFTALRTVLVVYLSVPCLLKSSYTLLRMLKCLKLYAWSCMWGQDTPDFMEISSYPCNCIIFIIKVINYALWHTFESKRYMYFHNKTWYTCTHCYM